MTESIFPNMVQFFLLPFISYIGIVQNIDLGRMANLRLVDKQGKELVELKLQVLVEVRTSSG